MIEKQLYGRSKENEESLCFTKIFDTQGFISFYLVFYSYNLSATVFSF